MKSVYNLLVLSLLIVTSCNSSVEEEIREVQEDKPETIEVCDGCTRSWYSQGYLINTITWGFEGCEADGNVYRYEDRDGTSATNHYPPNPGSSYVIRCKYKTIEL